ncbi:ATP-binding protein [Sansalvadorimonas sp. 2012CJ34-2]|uniref:histidine kinase n=1 Tax=Parendozoicomonas callyspongiae TaxID=2942213 RepID=A0ABT0PGS9_9GAMM|nr:ATP-binding protein [Sansalvadorimonas sp. 2012CJ34-2]MCL6269962.1 ATP-binding protein [Sansalvadorimonas sp. 2012CJ34-2]
MNGLQDYLSRLSISRKLVFVMLGVVLGVAFVSCAVLIVSAYLVSRNNFVPANIQAVSRILTEPTVLNTLLSDQDEAKKILQVASEYSQIQAIAIYSSDNRLYASFTHKELPISEEAPSAAEDETQYLKRVITGDDRRITLFIQADPSLPIDFYVGMTIAVIIILVFILLFSSLAAGMIRRFITQPVLHLISIANTVSIEENYGVRAQKFYHDEIGILAQTFNTMLSRIEARDQLLTNARDKAEQASLKAQALAIETHMSNKQLEQEVRNRKQTERQLTRLQSHLNSIVDSMPSALVAVDQELAVAQWNRAATVLTGIDHDRAMGAYLGDVMPFLSDSLEQVQDALDNESAVQLEKLSLILPGGERKMDLMIYPLTDADQHGAVIRLDDISRRLQLEEMMVQTEKMMSVGGLAAGMAHEINNPLGAILQSIQTIQRRMTPELEANQKTARELGVSLDSINAYFRTRDINKFLDNIQSAGVRASQIVSNMLQFSRRDSRILTPTDLDDLIHKTLEIAASDFNLKQGFDFMRICIQQDFETDMPSVPCIPNEIQQVLLNLLKNAAQAISKRKEPDWQGHITIRTRKEGGKALISVEDNGTGMTEDVSRRIFEPFFTTKDIGSGTGLGLSVSYFIITNNHNGALTVSSTLGVGTTFTVMLNLDESFTDSGAALSPDRLI